MLRHLKRGSPRIFGGKIANVIGVSFMLALAASPAQAIEPNPRSDFTVIQSPSESHTWADKAGSRNVAVLAASVTSFSVGSAVLLFARKRTESEATK
jgi:hypothetical protein